MPAHATAFVDSLLLAGLSAMGLLFGAAFAPRGDATPPGKLRHPLEALVVHTPGCHRAAEAHFVIGDGEILEGGVAYPQEPWESRRVLEHTYDVVVNGRTVAVRAPEGNISGAVRRLGRTLSLPARTHAEADGSGCLPPGSAP